MSHFSDLGGATLVNQFTIHHKDKLTGGRPFMSTCVPQAVYLDLFDVRISHGAEWKDNVKDPNDPNFRMRSTIWARGEMKDSITVFRMDGPIGTFREIADVIIKPLPKGHVGGTKRATSSDGIGFSGMSSHDVPEEGLMVEEPGTLLYVDPREDKWPSRTKDPHLCLEGYIDEAEFNSLMQRLSMTHAPIQKAEMRVLLELFQYEVEASLSEPSFRQDYGFLMRSKDNWGTTRARVETLQVTYQPNVVPPPPEAKIDEDGIYQPPTPFEPVSAAIVKKIEKHLKNLATVTAIGLTAIFIVLISR
ncbi:hypothetical protein [Rhizobium mongolense]|uniref:Uncharacterized protein n=2 Tax=Rhizobium mongolense TaxID=57676 RepID=A0ABR6IXK5_9HYPH|nr:hypothetical protein [Rhizobium mongolense]MBB4232658.1 hypothetical protein [Rhizobium mongolense]TVZ74811.1 hypothetical protein BCL32_0128 [Rhizobium mongolense USDA 1844]